MEKQRLKIICFVFLLLVHVALSALYIFRDSVSPRIASWAISYCSPLFHQNWMLFAPNVSEYDLQLQYCTSMERPQNWLDISRESSGSSPMERAERYFANALTWDYVNLVFTSDDSLNYDSFVQSRSYQNARKWACNYLQKTHAEFSDSLRMRLFYKFYDARTSHGVARLDSIQLPPCSCMRHVNTLDVNSATE